LALIGVTRIPSGTDACSPGGSGFVMAIDPFTGARLSSSYFDTNGDGVVNSSDTVGTTGIVASGIGLITGGNGVIAVGERLYGTLDNGGQFTPPPPSTTKVTSRVSWHEVIGN
jgi:type IV pilus assembly protein PilY1